uniref:Uncharacterized protein n=1 Tax=viral metagenome TaxID=1070528 RepID=A0A6C0KF24_9ZZZZ
MPLPDWFEAFVLHCQSEVGSLETAWQQCNQVHASGELLRSVHPAVIAWYLHFAEAAANVGEHN